MNLLAPRPARGRQGNAGEAGRDRVRDPPPLDGRDVPRGDRRRRPSSAGSVEPILASGELVPDELTVGADPRAAQRARRRAGASCSTASRATQAQATRSTRCCARSTASSTRSSSSTCRTTSPPTGCSGAPSEEGRHRRHAGGDRAPASRSTTRRPSRSSSTTGSTGKLVPLHADRSDRRGVGRDPAGARAGRGARA